MIPADLSELERDAYEERAAILEFDANLSRYEAERRAFNEIEKQRRLI
jgi:hypothetical protein